MMHILLRSHDRAVDILEFDTGDGRARVLHSRTLEESKKHVCHGYGSRINFKIVGLYTQEGRLWFQVGSFRLDLMKPTLQLVWKRTRVLFLNRFLILDGQRPCFKCTYLSAASNPLNILDFTFDGLDEELSDFFLWFYRQSLDPNWKAEMIAFLEKGI